MKWFDYVVNYFDAFDGKYEFLYALQNKAYVTNHELINCQNQLLTDLINIHAHSNLISKYVSLHSEAFKNKANYLFGDEELISEVIRVGSNLADHFGYCGYTSDSLNVADGFSLVIDRRALAFSHNDVRSMSDLISKNIRFSKAEYKSTNYDPAYQLPTYSILGVSFNVVPVEEIKYPFVEI